MKKIIPSSLDIKESYRVLTSIIAPRPIAFVSTMNKNKVPNAAPFCFFMGVTPSPPTIAFSVIRRGENKKDTIRNALYSLNYTNPNTLEASWFIPTYVDYNQVGLCYDVSKIVNIPLNRVQNGYNNNHMNVSADYLLSLFNNNLKINIEPLHQIKNTAPHMEYMITCSLR